MRREILIESYISIFRILYSQWRIPTKAFEKYGSWRIFSWSKSSLFLRNHWS
jgi:hypothetical protein